MAKDAVNRPQRSTKQRAAIKEALEAAAGFRSAQELHDDLKAEGRRVGLTTVYRNLQALAQAGEVDMLRANDGEVIYRRCESGEHHHHLVCTECGTSVEVASDEIERWAARVARNHGFTPVEHTAEVFGICATCSR
ncbi:MAG: transcriptional repressor [Actinomycetota bacterium]|nr:transcriptional repressor [Actinomycetota bacterium]